MNNEVITGDEGNAEAGDQPVTAEVEQAPAAPGRRGTFIMVAVLACVAGAALAASAYVYYRTRNIEEYGKRLGAIERNTSSLEDKLRSLNDTNVELGASIKDLESKQGLLRNSLDSMFQRQKDDSEDWALAEIEHLLIIATQEVSLNADVNTALAAMQSANARLKDMSDPALLNIRSQVLADINSLKSVNAVDIPGMAMYMADIINRVQQLPLKKSQASAPRRDAGAGNPEGAGQASLWKRLLRTVWHELKGLVVISREKDAGVLSLVPRQRYYLYQNLRMELDAARLAILQRDTDNLRASLELVQDWLGKYFDVNDVSVANIMDSLKRMSKVTLRPRLPDISSSLETLRAYIKQRATPEPGQPATSQDPAQP